MGTWWSGTWLVLERGLLDSVRSKTFKIVTTLLLLGSAAAVAVRLRAERASAEQRPEATLPQRGRAK